MIKAWRIFQAKHAGQALSGQGARQFGGRWNSKGTAVVYASSSLALGLLEIMAGLDDYAALLSGYQYLELEFPAELVETPPAGNLPEDWPRPGHPGLKAIGDEWVRQGRSAVLEVPSAVLPPQANYLLNPAHRDFARITAGPALALPVDSRLIKP